MNLCELSRQYQTALEAQRTAIDQFGATVSALDIIDQAERDTADAYGQLWQAWVARTVGQIAPHQSSLLWSV